MPSTCPLVPRSGRRAWGNGMMEYWNVDFKEKYSFIDFAVKRNLAISQFPISQKPLFHHSSIPTFQL